MEKLYEFLRGTVRASITGAQPEKLLNALAENGIEFWNCDPGDGYSMGVTVYTSDYPAAERLSARCMCRVQPVRRVGGDNIVRLVRRRRVLAGLIVVFALLIAWSSLYIWDIDVTGNDTVSDGEILRALEDNGVGIGTYWPGISNNMLRAGVLPQIEDISWLAVNVKSSHAVVKVRERTFKPKLADEDTPTNVIASKTGIITDMSVLQGKPAVEKGNAVLAGETIVSGAMDSLPGQTRKVHALADIQAETLYELNAVCPDTAAQKTQKGALHSRFALIIGKKRINFYRGSRNSRADCDKIIKTIPFSVKGVFTLPVSIVKESFVRYTGTNETVSAEERMKTGLMDRLKNGMLPGGKVVSSSYSVSRAGGLITVTLRAECSENIAKVVPMSKEEMDSIDLANLNSKEEKTNDRTDH